MSKCYECEHSRSGIICPPCDNDFSGFEEKQISLAERYSDLQQENESMKYIIDQLCVKVNGYDQEKMLEDIKPLVIKHGGYQNAYTISNIIELIQKAKLVKNETH